MVSAVCTVVTLTGSSVASRSDWFFSVIWGPCFDHIVPNLDTLFRDSWSFSVNFQ